MPPPQKLHEVLPKAGLVVSEKGQLTEVLCKPKILPLKSVTLERIEKMEVYLRSLSKHAFRLTTWTSQLEPQAIRQFRPAGARPETE